MTRSRQPRVAGSPGPVVAGLLAALLAGALGVGCESHPTPTARPTGGGPSSAGSTGPAAAPPYTAAAPPYTAAAPPAGRPGALAAWTPAGTVRYSFSLWYAGVPVGRDGTGLLVAYPAVLVSSTGTGTVAHLKVPVFRCAGRVAPRSPNFGGCTRRQVEYGDLAAPAVRVSRAGRQITVAGRFPTYAYAAAVDRDPRLPAHWTGRTYLVRVDAQPGLPVPARARVLRAVGSVTLGSGAAAVTAAADFGYPNRLVLDRAG